MPLDYNSCLSDIHQFLLFLLSDCSVLKELCFSNFQTYAKVFMVSFPLPELLNVRTTSDDLQI